MNKNVKLNKWTIGIGIFVGLMILGRVMSSGAESIKNQRAKNLAEKQQVSPTAVEAKQSAVTYDVLGKTSDKVIENYAVLAKSGTPKEIAEEVKKKCTKQCNIDVYDDSNAFVKYKEYQLLLGDLSKQKEVTQWKQDNYVYVADHLVGSIEFETQIFKEYPLRDWHYKELKGIK